MPLKSLWKFALPLEELRTYDVSMQIYTVVYIDQLASNNNGASSCFRLKSELLPTQMQSESTLAGNSLLRRTNLLQSVNLREVFLQLWTTNNKSAVL